MPPHGNDLAMPSSPLRSPQRLATVNANGGLVLFHSAPLIPPFSDDNADVGNDVVTVGGVTETDGSRYSSSSTITPKSVIVASSGDVVVDDEGDDDDEGCVKEEEEYLELEEAMVMDNSFNSDCSSDSSEGNDVTSSLTRKQEQGRGTTVLPHVVEEEEQQEDAEDKKEEEEEEDMDTTGDDDGNSNDVGEIVVETIPLTHVKYALPTAESKRSRKNIYHRIRAGWRQHQNPNPAADPATDVTCSGDERPVSGGTSMPARSSPEKRSIEQMEWCPSDDDDSSSGSSDGSDEDQSPEDDRNSDDEEQHQTSRPRRSSLKKPTVSYNSSSVVHTRNKQRRSVSFTTLHIRHYNQVLGDHPCCSTGPPISLGWNYTPAQSVELDEYESNRTSRRSRKEMRLGCDIRREILLNTCRTSTVTATNMQNQQQQGGDAVVAGGGCGYTAGDFRRVERRLYRERVNRGMNGFFFKPPGQQQATAGGGE